VSPDELIARFGADTLRVYTLFIGPPEKESEWSEEGVAGAWRFLQRVHDVCGRVAALFPDARNRGERPEAEAGGGAASGSPLLRIEHRTVQRVTEDAQRFHFHTAVSALMEFQRALAEALDERSETPAAMAGAAQTLIRLLHPIAPHLTEEWWERFGNPPFLLDAPWPTFDPALATSERITLVVQVNGKVRGRLNVERGAAESDALALARADEKIRPWVEGKEIARAVYVPDRLLNLVVR
ncbi:MAG: class I tRNA ligase family protein, partial [Acidobacteriota bacterium]|nr:class I tRNA ligase family protein [Acidobacteriota bacterium]